MTNQFDITTYIKYNNNLIKNLKKMYHLFNNEDISFLNEMLKKMNTVEPLTKMFLQIFIKHGMVSKNENVYQANINSLPMYFNQFNVKIYIDLLEQISKYLNSYVQIVKKDNVYSINIDEVVKEQLFLMKEKFPKRILGVYNAIVEKTQQQIEYDEQQNQKNVLNLCSKSIIRGQQFLNQCKMIDSKIVDGQTYVLNNVELMESSILGEKHLGLAQSNVKTSLVDGQTYDEVNRIAGFYNNGDSNKSNGLGYYD